jgi:hypothetical protein
LEDDGKESDAEGAAYLLCDAGQDARLGHVDAVQTEIRDSHERDRDGAEPESADDEGSHEQPLVGCGGGDGEGDGGESDDGEAGHRHRFGADPVGEPSGQRAAQERTDSLGHQQQACHQWVRAAHVLPVQG